jgi:hypothetical protein
MAPEWTPQLENGRRSAATLRITADRDYLTFDAVIVASQPERTSCVEPDVFIQDHEPTRIRAHWC